MELSEVFGEPIQSNVFLVQPADDLTRFSAVADEKHFSIYCFDGSQFASKWEFFDHFTQVMSPPETFVNWDYLVRQLELTEWLEKGTGEVIIYKGIEHFHGANRKDFDILLDIFFCVTKFRNSRPHLPSLLVFLQGSKPLDLHFPFQTVVMSVS